MKPLILASTTQIAKSIPEPVQYALETLTVHRFKAHIVGGCVRDLLLQREPKDWDITTDATPQEIQRVFPNTLYNNRFGTVVVRHHDMELEITPYRSEGKYTDHRHPDAVTFGKTLKQDLARRDFTINAMAMNKSGRLSDPFYGKDDLKKKQIRAVGDPSERFSEDALRLLRCIRFAGQLDFHVEEKTWSALCQHVQDIHLVSQERIRDELLKILSSDDLFRSFYLLDQSRLLDEILSELSEGRGVAQNKHHIYTVLYHNIFSAQYCPSSDPILRLAALLHDVGKVRTKQGNGRDAIFHDHDKVGAHMARAIMTRLRFPNEDIERVEHFVRYHMFYYSVGEVSDKGVRRLLVRLGKEHLKDFFIVRIADRMGSGCQIEVPYKLKELWRHLEEVQKDPIDTRMLKIHGNDVMELLGIPPGPEVGRILNALLEEVLDDPQRNTREYLLERTRELYQGVA
ncbi:MAG: HDIG domain-containing protein [Candidatus Kerfeldbacteria bacterium]|nr:HDIG domain-containing protein [Candidatus Kerfeldbacteria bacterium]